MEKPAKVMQKIDFVLKMGCTDLAGGRRFMGHLKIEIDKTADIQTTAVTLGSVAVGGRYGEKLHPDRRWAIRVNTAATRRVQNRLPGF